jgi:hypothetical protein
VARVASTGCGSSIGIAEGRNTERMSSNSVSK